MEKELNIEAFEKAVGGKQLESIDPGLVEHALDNVGKAKEEEK